MEYYDYDTNEFIEEYKSNSWDYKFYEDGTCVEGSSHTGTYKLLGKELDMYVSYSILGKEYNDIYNYTIEDFSYNQMTIKRSYLYNYYDDGNYYTKHETMILKMERVN